MAITTAMTTLWVVETMVDGTGVSIWRAPKSFVSYSLNEEFDSLESTQMSFSKWEYLCCCCCHVVVCWRCCWLWNWKCHLVHDVVVVVFDAFVLVCWSFVAFLNESGKNSKFYFGGFVHVERGEFWK